MDIPDPSAQVPGLKKFLPITGAAEKRNFWCRRLPCATRTLPTRKNSTRNIVEITVTRFELFRINFKKITRYPRYLCELHDITRLRPLSLSNYFLITVTRFEVFRINWVMFSWQMEWFSVKIYKTNFSKIIVLAQFIFCKNYKTISFQSKFLRMFSCKQGQTSGSNITKNMFWWNSCCNNYKDYYKNNGSKELFCNTVEFQTITC